MKRTLIVERLIEEKWKSRRKFAEHIGIPPTTLQSILKRGVGNASIDNVIKICKGLGHNKISTTYDIYAHLYPNKEDEAVLEMENDFKPAEILEFPQQKSK